MDREHFDALARLVSTKQSRRSAVAALLGATLLGHDPDATLARDKRKVKGRQGQSQERKPCYPGKNCIPGKGKNTSGCDFSHSTLFKNKDVRGANLSNSNFFAADLEGADFRGANLSGSCFVAASLLNAKLGSSVNLGNAVFCHTLMPDGSFNMSGCEHATACCPVCPGRGVPARGIVYTPGKLLPSHSRRRQSMLPQHEVRQTCRSKVLHGEHLPVRRLLDQCGVPNPIPWPGCDL